MLVRGSHSNIKVLARLWIAPELDFAALRQEEIHLQSLDAPGQRAVLRCAWVTRATGFAKSSVDLWYPQSVQVDFFDYDEGKHLEAWDTTRVLRIQSLDVNVPLTGIVTPYHFPFDTTIHDVRRPEVQHRPLPLAASEALPDAFGIDLTAERAVSMVDGIR